MRKTAPEAWMLLLMIVAAVLLPVILGTLLLKVYRKFNPLPELSADAINLAMVANQKDGFFKVLLVGAIASSPIYYYCYNLLLTA